MRSQYLIQDLQQLADYIKKLEIGGSNIMLTGATGLIGSLIVKSIIEYNKNNLSSMIHVIALARNPEKMESVFEDEIEADGSIPSVTFVYQDICEPISISCDCDYIIHTANSTTSKYFITNPVEVIDSIYIGTKNVLEYGKKCNVKGIVYLSSMEVFGRTDGEKRIQESELGYIDIQNVRSCYSEGKRLAELLCKSYSEEYKLPIKVARLAQTFGAGVPKTENRVFAQFARNAIKGEDIVLHTTGQSVGNYCYTADAIRAILLLLKQGNSGDAYTIVNEETTRTIAEMAHMVAEEFSDERSKVVFDIPEGNAFGYAPDTKMRLSSVKMRSLGWNPEVSLKEMYVRMLGDL